MAPDTIAEWLEDLPHGSTVLDPMCGSGVVVRQALMHGHKGIGLDLDPLAVLMTKVWTSPVSRTSARKHTSDLVDQVAKLRKKDVSLPWIDGCDETRSFIDYWFAEPQKTDLMKLSFLLSARPKGRSKAVNDLLHLALSRTIITKHAGASLAWDVSHSRPHKVRDENEYDVLNGFAKAVDNILTILASAPCENTASVYRGDTRSTKRLFRARVDAIVTSPPYLNAIDYLRGHKFSLVWMGYTIPQLRELRSSAVGTERGLRAAQRSEHVEALVGAAVPELACLPNRSQAMIWRYAHDALDLLKAFKRCIRPHGRLVLVLGDCTIKGQFIRNSNIYDVLAADVGFIKQAERKRELDLARRYLPVTSSNNSLEKRMRHEVIQVYEAIS